MRYQVLGPISVVRDGETLDLGPHKQRALLALLLIHADRVVTTDRIIQELWGDDGAEKQKAVWAYISRLRSLLEPEREKRADSSVIVRHDHGYRLELGGNDLDAHLFEQRVESARRIHPTDPAEVSSLLHEALALWQGEAFGDFLYDDFAQHERHRLTTLRAEAFEDRIEADLATGRHAELIAELENHMLDFPFRERPVGQLMTSMYRAGRPADALRVFERFRRRIGEELGIEPTPELVALEERILVHDARLRPPTGDSAGRSSSARVVFDNPYAGLRTFRREDADRFFGRDALVADVIRRLNDGSPLVALVGASGSGKSSAVNAGLIPALEKGSLEGSDHWPIATMVPGRRPFAELEAALNRATLEEPGDLLPILTSGSQGILRGVLRTLSDPTHRLILVIDQFEELYTLVADPAEREAFLDALSTTLEDPQNRILLILTLRADFYDRPLTHARFAQHLGRGVVNVAAMSPEELEQAVTGPARVAGVDVEPKLLSALVADVIGQPSVLPLFQHTLRELFDRRDSNTMTFNAYEALGRIEGTLIQRAEDIFRQLDDDESTAARQILLRLVTIQDTGEWTRRRVTASELLSLELDPVAIQDVLVAFADHRLISFDRDQVTGSPVIDVAHESLLTEWPRLRAWIDAAHSDVRRHARLTEAASEWRDADCDEDYLFTGNRLAEHSRWADETTMLLTADQRSFLTASLSSERTKQEALAEHESVVAKLDRRARRRLYALLTSLTTLVALAGLAVYDAVSAPPTVAMIYSAKTATDAQIAAGLDRARDAFGLEVIEITPPFADFDAAVSEALAQGPQLVIVDEFFASEASQFVPVHADIEWVFLDQSPGGSGFAVEEAGFLAGTIAALNSDAPLGFVGEARTPTAERLRAGFEAGASAARANAEVIATYAVFDPWPGAGSGDEVVDAALGLYDAGAEVVFGADGSHHVFEAAARASENGQRTFGIGLYIDHYFEVPAELRDHVLTSVVKRYDGIVYSIISSYIESGEIARVSEWSLDQEAIAYVISGGHLGAETALTIEALREQVVTGDRTAPLVPVGSVMAPAGTTAVDHVAVVFDGTTCDASGGSKARMGQHISVEFENKANEDASVVFEGDATTVIPARAGRTATALVRVMEDHRRVVCTWGGSTVESGHAITHTATTEGRVVVVVDRDGCSMLMPESATAGGVIEVDVDNRSGAPAGVYTWFVGSQPEVRPALPDFDDAARLLRWVELAPDEVGAYATPVHEGTWAVGCSIEERHHLAGTFRVPATTASG